MIERYYAQHTAVDEVYLSGHGTAWQVFDRERLTQQGATRAIAICVDKNSAFTIRDALNKASSDAD